MNFDEANATLRSGNGELRPVIDWLASEQDAAVLLPLLLEPDLRPSVLYVFSELPSQSISAAVTSAVKQLMSYLPNGSAERAWALDILLEASDP